MQEIIYKAVYWATKDGKSFVFGNLIFVLATALFVTMAMNDLFTPPSFIVASALVMIGWIFVTIFWMAFLDSRR